MNSQSYSVVLGFGFQAINRKQRGAVAFEVFSLDTLVKFKGLVEDISGVIILSGKMWMGIILLFEKVFN